MTTPQNPNDGEIVVEQSRPVGAPFLTAALLCERHEVNPAGLTLHGVGNFAIAQPNGRCRRQLVLQFVKQENPGPFAVSALVLSPSDKLAMERKAAAPVAFAGSVIDTVRVIDLDPDVGGLLPATYAVIVFRDESAIVALPLRVLPAGTQMPATPKSQ